MRVGWVLFAVACGGGESPPPNFLIVTLDTLRADVLGAYGHEAGASPHLDRLAAESVRFDRAYTVTPLTIPAHSSLWTGQYPPRHGVRDNGDFFLRDDATTLAERLRAAGWSTGAAVGAEVTSHHWGFAQGFDRFMDDLGTTAGGSRWEVERPGNLVVDDLLGWLDHQGTDGPWMAWAHLFDVHDPYQPPEPYRTTFVGRPYLGEVAWTDAQVGRLVDQVLDREDAGRTWILVLSDHGEGLGAHGEGQHGVLLYDPTTRIPLLVRPPGGGAGLVDPDPASLVDVMPTVLALAGLPAANVDGRDLGPRLRGARDPGREVYLESLYARHHYGWAPMYARVDGEAKLIRGGHDRLFLKEDRGERLDVARRPELLAPRAERLTSWITELETKGPTASAGGGMTAAQVAQLRALGYVVDTVQPELASNLDPEQELPRLADLQRVRTLTREGKPAEALALLEPLVLAQPGLTEPRFLRVSLLQMLDRTAEAKAEAEALDAARPTAQSRRTLGLLMLDTEPDQALNLLREAVDRDPGLAEAHMALMQALLVTGRLLELDAASERAIEARPDDLRIGGMRAVVRALKGEAQAVEDDLRAALAADPGAPLVRHALGLAHRARGDDDAAERWWVEEILGFPPAVPTRRELVALLAAQRRYADQLEQLDVIVRHEPPVADTAHSRAQALFNLGRWDEAGIEVDRCRNLAPEYAGCTMLKANVLKKQGYEAEARATFELAKKQAAEAAPR
jgi:arylsulfatase A-like enzyme/Flp pilus assembly protein TadD